MTVSVQHRRRLGPFASTEPEVTASPTIPVRPPDEDLSGGPVNTSRSGRDILTKAPTVTTTPPIADLLGDIRALIKSGLDGLKPRIGHLTPNDARTLESLARTAKVAQDMDAALKAGLGTKLNTMSDADIRELALELGLDPEALKGSGGA
jgi:hypothetical protein